VLSAFGTLVTPVRIDLVRSALGRPSTLDWSLVDAVLREMSDEADAALAEAGCHKAETRFSFGADLRYFGQQNEVTITFPEDPRQDRDSAEITRIFEAAYFAQYGVLPSHVPVEIVSWRLTATGPDTGVEHTKKISTGTGDAKSSRRVSLWRADELVPVYERSRLAASRRLDGPAIIEERETTIVLPPGWHAVVNDIGCIVARQE
jgi:N-methylhydantoinase A